MSETLKKTVWPFLLAPLPFFICILVTSDLALNNAINPAASAAWWIRLGLNALLGFVGGLIAITKRYANAIRFVLVYILNEAGYEIVKKG